MYQHRWWALVPILAWTLSGCTSAEPVEHRSWLNSFQNQAISPEHALIEVALIECPLGDEYVNGGLWQQTDELIIDLDRHRLLEENGLRIGQLVGAPPAEFQQLLLNKRCNANPEAMIFPAGRVVPIYLGATRAHSSFEIVLEKRRDEVNVDQARFCFDVTASFASDGRTKLTFIPKVENSDTLLPFTPSPDYSTWELRTDKANEKYAELKWEVTLGLNQYMFVGGRMDREHTLGKNAFQQDNATDRVQRLLIVRNCRALTAQEAHNDNIEALVRANHALPLAIQAGVPAIRANGHGW